MKKDYLSVHFSAISKRYGITNINGFARSARRYECLIARLNTLEACDARRAEWAARQLEVVRESARVNLAKYCRNRHQFARELYINSDPRGFALKLEIKNAPLYWHRVTLKDWGGFFIVAPKNNDWVC